MGNPIKGETKLVLDDEREFTLVLDMEALLSVEESTGKPLHVVMGQIGEGYLGAIAAFGQAAFARHHPEVTRAEVLMMVAREREPLSDAIGKAIEAAFPDAEPEGNAPAPKAKKPQRGKTSGRSGAKRS